MATRTSVRELGAIGAVIDVTADDGFVATAVMLEELGFATIWLSGGRLESLDQILAVLAATDSARVGTSIIAADRFDSDAVLELYRRAEESSPGRLVVGLGGAHGPRPLATLGAYLDRLAAVPAGSRLLAALGSRMLGLARDRAAGALPVLVTPEYTASARAALGDAGLVVEQMVVLEHDPGQARGIAAGPLGFLATIPAYARNFRRMGFTDDDIDRLSDNLVDSLVAWGDAAAVAGRVAAHRACGADHVAVMLLNGAGERAGWASLAHALLAPGTQR
ncbi:MAG: TIGR03620 family F420-dependent LLM class oxidoreductase [Pseudonocardia sp.]|nr:TIGR03620 family F420-dependent LLM class oxidoreductase [Pseudonocardia sp.]